MAAVDLDAPPWVAITTATLLFGFAHAYQGPAGIPKTALVGAVMAALTLWAGTLGRRSFFTRSSICTAQRRRQRCNRAAVARPGRR